MRRKRNKLLYKIGKEKKLFIHELVMKADYTPDSMLAPVFTGPYRITELAPGGATLRDIKTGELHNVAFEHIRKITLQELLALLPQNFDEEIMRALDTYRYRRNPAGADPTPDPDPDPDENIRTLRSGRLYNIAPDNRPSKAEIIRWRRDKGRMYLLDSDILPRNVKRDAEVAYWRRDKLVKRNYIHDYHSILTKRHEAKQEFRFKTTDKTRLTVFHTTTTDDGHIDRMRRKNNEHEVRNYYSTVDYKSYFASPEEGTLIVKMKREPEQAARTRVQFKEITVHFYNP